MITLGHHDQQVPSSQLQAYIAKVRQFINLGDQLRNDTGNLVRFKPISNTEPMTVAEVQQTLKDIGFFPGGVVDGICGYRTLAAIRLFQEYVRSVEKIADIGVPDGLFGKGTGKHLKRWIAAGLKANWQDTVQAWQSGNPVQGEFTTWLTFLNGVKQHYLNHPTLMLQKVEAFQGETDTIKVADWDFDPQHIHMIGVRRKEHNHEHKFDDILILLIKGMVFKFQGSTDPGHTRNAGGAPFLVQGQHNYHFGWHQSKYRALRPHNHDRHGVLVVRSKGDFMLTDEDVQKGVETNGTINIHWGGRGVARNVNNWSEGCQVIAGTGYINHLGDLVECKDVSGRSFVAINNGAVSATQTRGAYNVLADLVTALSGDMNSSVIKYMLLQESDLGMSAEVAGFVTDAQQQARPLIDRG